MRFRAAPFFAGLFSLMAVACSHRPPVPVAASPYNEESLGTSSGLVEKFTPRHAEALPPMPPAQPVADTPVHPNWWLLSLSVVTLGFGALGGFLFGRRTPRVAKA